MKRNALNNILGIVEDTWYREHGVPVEKFWCYWLKRNFWCSISPIMPINVQPRLRSPRQMGAINWISKCWGWQRHRRQERQMGINLTGWRTGIFTPGECLKRVAELWQCSQLLISWLFKYIFFFGCACVRVCRFFAF